MATEPTEFTLHADIFRAIADTSDIGADIDLLPVTGLEVYFDPDLDTDAMLAVELTPRSILIRPERVTGYIRSNGRMYDQPSSSSPPNDITDAGNLGVRLLASSPNLNLETPLTYMVSFETSTLQISPWHIPAPETDVTVDLASLAPVPGALPQGILRGPPGSGVDGVRLNTADQIVFTYQGVDLPVPLDVASSGGFEHIQLIPAATWTIANQLGRFPRSVNVIVGGLEVIADVEMPNVNSISVVFSTPQSGRAEII